MISSDYLNRSHKLSFRKENILEEQILTVKHIKKCFGKTEILHDLDFSVKTGEVYGLVGKNGAGKTTLLRLIAGLMKPTQGAVTLHTQKNYIGYMPQSCRFDDRQTVSNTISFFASLRQADIQESIQLCRKLGLDIAKKVRYLSPGQQKKLQMVIAMAGDPDLYILDEPTAGLDPDATYEMGQLIKGLHNQEKSILISSHILQDLDEICTNIAIMEDGHLIYNQELENSYILSTSALTDGTLALLLQEYSIETNAGHTVLRVRTDKQGIANLIKILVMQSISVYGVSRSNVKNVVQEQLHMADTEEQR